MMDPRSKSINSLSASVGCSHKEEEQVSKIFTLKNCMIFHEKRETSKNKGKDSSCFYTYVGDKKRNRAVAFPENKRENRDENYYKFQSCEGEHATAVDFGVVKEVNGFLPSRGTFSKI